MSKNYIKKHIFIILTFLFFLLSFSWFFHYFSSKFTDGYKIMWLNFLGADYKLPLETPKPLIALLAGVLSHYYYFFIAFCLSLLGILLILFSQEFICFSINGLFAFLLYFFGNLEGLQYFFSGYWPVVYLPFLFLSYLLFIKKYYSFSFFFLFLTGLIRPESWFIELIFLGWLMARKEKIKIIYFLPLLSPLIWCVFDYKISGNPFFSYLITKRYALISGFAPVTFIKFFSYLFKSFFIHHNFLLILLGISLILTRVMILRKNEEILLFIIGITPILFYWIFTLKKEIIIYPRFFSFFILTIYIYICFFPSFFLKKIKRKKMKSFLNILFLSTLFLISFDFKVFKKYIDKKVEKKKEFLELQEAVKFLKAYFAKEEMKEKVIISARKAGVFFLQLGPEFSHHTVYFREVGRHPALFSKNIPALAIYTCDVYKNPLPTTLFFVYLHSGKESFIVNRPMHEIYKVVPIFFSSHRKVIIYKISKIKVKNDNQKPITSGGCANDIKR